jgi:hypothetical protein
MSKIPAPAPSPYETELLAEFTKHVPESTWDIIAMVAKHVEVEREAIQVRAFQRAASARAHQISLFGLLAASAESGDRERYAFLANFVQHVDGYRASFRSQAG